MQGLASPAQTRPLFGRGNFFSPSVLLAAYKIYFFFIEMKTQMEGKKAH